MAANGGVPIVESARAGFDFMRNSIRAIAPAGLLVTVLALGASLLSPAASGEARDALLGFVLSVCSIAAGIAYLAYVLRLALGRTSGGFLGLQFGKDELSLVGSLIVVGFFYLIFIALAVVIFSFAFAIVAPLSGIDITGLAPGDEAGAQALIVEGFTGPARVYLWPIILAEVGVFAWIIARLSLASISTIAEGRVMAFSTWSWTKGNGFAVLASLMAPFALNAVVIVLIYMNLLPRGSALIVTLALIGLIQNIIATPLYAGTSAHLYRGLRPPDLPAK